MKQSKIICALAVIGSSLLALTANASFLSFTDGDALIPGNQLAGTIQTSGWDDLTSSRLGASPSGYGAHGDQGAWEKSIAANHGVATAELFKTSGYGYVASSAIHQGYRGGADGRRGGDFVVSSLLIDNAATIIFQIQLTEIADVSFYQENNHIAYPSLQIGTHTLAADWQVLVVNQDNGSSYGTPSYLQSWAFQWDLTTLDFAPNADFEINWTGVAQSEVYALQLDQSDQFSQVIPEPGHYALLFSCALSGLLWLRRRKS